MAMTALFLAGAMALDLDVNYGALADRIVKALAPLRGEKVLLVCQPGNFDGIVGPLRKALAAAGAEDLGCEKVGAAPAAPPTKDDAALAEMKAKLLDVDASVMLPGATPAHPPYAALQQLLTEARGPRRTIHFHWDGGSAPSATPLPGGSLPPREKIDALYEHAVLKTDYAALAAVQAKFEAAMRATEVRVTTPAGTDLRFRIGDRPVNRQDGNASAARAQDGAILVDREIEIPAGGVRVAPLEESVSGTIAFPDATWDGRAVRGLKLTFAKGRVVAVAAEAGQEAVEAEMQKAGNAGGAFREFVLGFNPLLAVPDDRSWIPYYGYGAGVVRLSLGDNSELGGSVTGGYVRWNFFADATVTVGDDTWVQGGKLLERR